MFDLGRSFLATVERSPQALAIVDGARRLNYAQWYREISAVAAELGGLGLKRGDRLAVILQNRLAMASLHWACQFLGLVVTPLNWRIKADEIDYCLSDAEARAVVFDPVAAEAVAGSAAARAIPRIAIDDAAGGTVRFVDWTGGAEVSPQAGAEGRAAPAPRRARRFARPCCAEPLRPRRAHPRGHAALPYDGGAFAAGDGPDRRNLRLPAALRSRRCAGADRARAHHQPLPGADAV
jgi:hypothetical protein